MRWPDDGIPDNPAAWLTTAAYRRALDVLRRRRVEAQKLQEVAAMVSIERSSTGEPDPYAGYTATSSCSWCSRAAIRRCRLPAEWH